MRGRTERAHAMTPERAQLMRAALREALTGHRIVYTSATHEKSRNAQKDMVRLAGPDTMKRVSLARGDTRIDFHSGGSITFVSTTDRGGRGLSNIDTLILDEVDIDHSAVAYLNAGQTLRTETTP